MERINKIYNLEAYRSEVVYIANDEKERIYCKHNLEHFLDVARIAYMMNLEQNLGYDKEIIYAVGLLHDIGRHREYESGLNHHIASTIMAREILKQTGFCEDEVAIICDAIQNHRNKEKSNKLNEIIYKADKLSRKCYACSALSTCKWPSDKKNKDIEY
ncbi:MAG: HD domain-containing protein [Lachnospiraceae bacterium]|nr:HD domain-containing protein [Lachnospiraceae bacterium]